MNKIEKRIFCSCMGVSIALGIAMIILINRVSKIQDVVIDDNQYIMTSINYHSAIFTNSIPYTTIGGITETNRGTNQTINQE